MRASWIGIMMAVCGATLAGAGCKTIEPTKQASREPAVAPTDEGREEAEAERLELEHELAVAERRLDKSRMEHEIHELSSAFEIEAAEHELKHAMAVLEDFVGSDMPNRVASSELSLQGSKDSAAEAAEELAQIMIMYEEQDLEDMTAEFVIQRGRRRAERAQRSLEIQASEHEALVESELPREKKGLEMEVRRKQHALELATRRARAGRLEKEIALVKAEFEIQELRRKIEKLGQKVEG